MDFYFICVVNSVFLLIPLHNIAALINICRFLINFVLFMQTPTKLDLSTLRKCSTEEWTQRNKQKICHALGLEPRSSAYQAPMLYPLSYMCQLVELNLCPYKLSNLKFTPLPSIHVDIYSQRVVNSIFMLVVQLIPLHNTAALINICRF